MGLVAFSLMLVIAAFECRDEKATALRSETFDNRTLNITALVEIVLAVLIARGGDLTSLLGGAGLTETQWLIGAAPAVLLLILWDLGKAIARSRSGNEAKGSVPGGERLTPTTPSPATCEHTRWPSGGGAPPPGGGYGQGPSSRARCASDVASSVGALK